MSLKLVEVEFSVWPFVKAAKRAFWVSERVVQDRSGCERVNEKLLSSHWSMLNSNQTLTLVNIS